MSAHDDMRERAFTVTSEAALGFAGLRHVIGEGIFTAHVMLAGADHAGPVPDRLRVKDVMHYRRGDGDEAELTELADDGCALVRLEHVPRFRWLDVPGCREMTVALLALIPPEDRHESGTFGVHAFRSFSDVVNAPHQDGFEYGITYVIARAGDGAVSYLNDLGSGARVLDRQLQPGEILLFRDDRFTHGATPLAGDPRHRDALVIQFDAPEDLQGAARDPARP